MRRPPNVETALESGRESRPGSAPAGAPHAAPHATADRARWRRLLGYVRPERRRLAGLLALVLLGVACEALLPWPLKLIVDHALGGQPWPPALAWIGEFTAAAGPAASAEPAESAESATLLVWLCAGFVLLVLTRQGLQIAKAQLQAELAGRLQYQLAGDLFAHLLRLSLRYHGAARRGDLVRRLTVDSACVPTLVTGIGLPLVVAVLTLLVLFAIMWQLDPALALLTAGVALPLGGLMARLGPRMSERAYQHQQRDGEVWTQAEQTLSALPLVQAFGREAHEGSRFAGAARRTIAAYMSSLAAQLQFKLGVDSLVALGTAATMLVGGWQVLAGQASLGTLVIFLSYLTALYAPLVTLAYLSPSFAGAVASARRLLELLDADDWLAEPMPPRPLAPAADGGRGEVRLQGVVFGYQPGRPVLKGIDLTVQRGETLALVGPTGAGKSTLAALIPRLFDPWQGSVAIDGQDLRTVSLASLRAQVALLLQEPLLLPLSVADNIAYGRPDAGREAIVAAAVAANADEFIRALPRGYDEVLGERGATLSGGQRQRLAIARALLKDAPVLILDEPTAALDSRNEAAVVEAIRRLCRGRSTLIIAHRLSTLRHADRIVLLERGRIAASGSHATLLEGCESYRRLFALSADQDSAARWATG